MKLTIPANWQDDFFDAVDLSAVHEVYGKLPGDFVGGGRASVIFHDLPLSVFREHVAEFRRRGLAFNYLLNATCLDNLELTRKGNKRIRQLLDMVSEAGASGVTVALPHLIPMIRKSYPDLEIAVSTNNMVDNLERVRYWCEFGVDKITLSYTDVNRNFRELARIVRHADCQVQLICNLICRRHCPFQALHANFHSHASQTEHVNDRFPIDYYCMFCLSRIFSDPYEVLKAPWIRPEDLHHYEAVGIEHFKLTERGMNTPDLARVVSAYTARRYEGNFLDLIPSMSKYQYITEPRTGHLLKYFKGIGRMKVLPLVNTLRSLLSMRDQEEFFHNFGIRVDNRKLDGFLDFFLEMRCSDTVCEECGYCDRWARDAVELCEDPEDRERALATIRSILDNMTSGAMY